MAVAKKIGLLGLVLIFLKKGFIIVLAAGAGLWGWIKRKMGREQADCLVTTTPLLGQLFELAGEVKL